MAKLRIDAVLDDNIVMHDHGIDDLLTDVKDYFIPYSLFDKTKDPTGFTSPENVVVNYDSSTKKITLTGTVEAYFKGKVIPVLVSGWVSPAISATPTEPYFLYYDGTNFVWSTDSWTFDMLQIAFVYYRANGTFLFCLHETHGFMPWQDHLEFHSTIGAYKSAGGVFSSYTPASTTAANRRPDISSTTVKDEDLATVNAALTSKSYTQAYLANGGSITSTWANADIVPLSGANPYWNEYSGGTWNQTLMANNSYMCVWVIAFPASSDADSQRYRYFFIQGQSNGSLVQEQSKTPNDVALGGLLNIAAEFVFIGKIILRYTASNWSITQIDQISGTKLSQTISSAATTTHNSLPGLQGGTTDEYYHLTAAQATIVGNTSGTNTGDQTIPTKASGSDIDTGTDDAKFATSKALADQTVLLKKSGGTMTGNILQGENTALQLDTVLSADEKYCGITEIGTMGYSATAGDLVYLAAADTKWEKAKANAASTSGPVKLGIVTVTTAENSTCEVLLWGKIRSAAFPAAFTVGAPVYISAATAGAVVVAAPTGTTNFVVRIIGYGNTAEDLFFCPDKTFVELA